MTRRDVLKVEAIPSPTKSGRFTIRRWTQVLPFDKGFFVTVRAIQVLRQKTPGQTIVVGIAGPSGAGKSTLAQKVTAVLPQTLVISMDNYLDPTDKVVDGNFDDYRLMDFDLLVKNTRDLREGRSSELPLYDFRKSGRYAYVSVTPPASKVIIIEGTYALHERVRPELDLMVSISGGVHYDLIKRVLRDVHRTGQTGSESIAQVTQTVYPMYKAFIEPDLLRAHVRILNHFDPLGGLLNPVYSMKSTKVLDEGTIAKHFEREAIKKVVEKYFDIYLQAPGELAVDIPMSSFIRVRNHGGKYTVTFSEDMREGDFIISPTIDFTVTSLILGGLMALGYQIAAITSRTSAIWHSVDRGVTVILDHIDQLGRTFIQVKGSDPQAVQKEAHELGLDGTYIPKPYIELYQERYKRPGVRHASAFGEGEGEGESWLPSRL